LPTAAIENLISGQLSFVLENINYFFNRQIKTPFFFKK